MMNLPNDIIEECLKESPENSVSLSSSSNQITASPVGFRKLSLVDQSK